MRRPHLILSRLALACAVSFTAGFLAPAASAQDAPTGTPPEAPAGVPKPDLVTAGWKFTFTHTHPTTFSVEQPDGTVKWYWYFTYKVVNQTDQPLRFTPEIVISDDQGRIAHANRGINVTVFRKLRDLVRNPLLLSPGEVPGQMFPGEDYAREGVAIWPVSNHDVDQFQIFFGGLYEETKTVTDPTTGSPIMVPATDPRTGEPKTDANGQTVMVPLQVRRVRKMHYDSPGTLERPQEMRADLIQEIDVMR